jgi:predicted RNA-binding Zn-ribbon protein involved in translation (DUF1610 family)
MIDHTKAHDRAKSRIVSKVEWRKRIFKKNKQKKTPEDSESAEKETKPIKLNLKNVGNLKLTTIDGEEELEIKRNEAYIEPPVQRFLRILLQKGRKNTIIPSFDPVLGFRYEIAESAFENDVKPEEIENFLERLTHLQILKKDFFNTVSSCPFCNSVLLTLHFKCPKCSSRHIVRTGLTEHIPCGNIDEKDKFTQGNSQPRCPKCGALLVNNEYRDMGLWYVCRSCKERFEHPNLDLVCRRCKKQFTVRSATIRDISKYALNWEKEEEIRQNVTSLGSISSILNELGFTVETPTMIIGEKSGIQHRFSLVAKKKIGGQEKLLVVDHAVGDKEIGAASLIVFNYKISDVSVDLPIFIAIPKLNETAKKIAQGQNILVIEGLPEQKEQLTKISEDIQKRLKEKMVKDRLAMKSAETQLVHQWIFRKGKKIDVWRNLEGKFVKYSDETQEGSAHS